MPNVFGRAPTPGANTSTTHRSLPISSLSIIHGMPSALTRAEPNTPIPCDATGRSHGRLKARAEDPSLTRLREGRPDSPEEEADTSTGPGVVLGYLECWPRPYFRTVRTSRKPVSSPRLHARWPRRCAARISSARLLQSPPRLMRREPIALASTLGPRGSVTGTSE